VCCTRRSRVENPPDDGVALRIATKTRIIVLGIEDSISALPNPPIVAGYRFDSAPDLTKAAERGRLSASAIKGFLKITEKWGLTEPQSRGLLGGIASSTFHAWRTRPRGRTLDQDTLMRISLVVGIYKALNIYFGKPWADQWVTLENRGSMFAGQAPIEYMLRRGQPGMMEVRRMLDSWRGGR
jgi:hypothetical protein